MKKLSFVFITLLVLVAITGCEARKDTMRFNTESDDSGITENTDDSGEVAGETEVNTGKDGAVAKGEVTVTSVKDGFLKTSKGYNLIMGTAPKGTHSVTVNNYTLKQYQPGQTRWSYIASTAIGTLKEGQNHFVVTALDAKGNAIDAEPFDIEYQMPAIPVLPNVGTSLNLIFLFALSLSGAFFFLRRKAA